MSKYKYSPEIKIAVIPKDYPIHENKRIQKYKDKWAA